MFEIAKPFLLSVALGLLVGIERERAFSEENRHIPFGARTFALIALLGTLAAHLSNPAVAFVLAAFVATIAIAAAVLWLKPRIHAFAREGLNDQEVKAALTFLVIALVVPPWSPTPPATQMPC